MNLNDDQRDHMKWLGSLKPSERCDCGWDSKENCNLGIGGVACTKRKSSRGAADS